MTLFDFCTVSGCNQLVIGPTHAPCGTLNLMMTDVPDLVRVAIVAPIDNSDHFALSVTISLAQVVPDLSVSRKVWSASVNICSDDNPVEVLNEHLSMVVSSILVSYASVSYTQSAIRVRNKDKKKSMTNAGMLLASTRRLIFGGVVIALWLTGKSLSAVKREPMKLARRPSVSLVSETGMYL